MKDIFPPNFNKSPEEAIKLVSYCPICHYHYNPIEAKILEEDDGAHLLYIKCRRCKSSVLALINFSPFGVSSFGLVTDLDGSEVLKFKNGSCLSSDDVLAVYEALKEERLEF